jgi:hypothetical protein
MPGILEKMGLAWKYLYLAKKRMNSHRIEQKKKGRY